MCHHTKYIISLKFDYSGNNIHAQRFQTSYIIILFWFFHVWYNLGAVNKNTYSVRFYYSGLSHFQKGIVLFLISALFSSVFIKLIFWSIPSENNHIKLLFAGIILVHVYLTIALLQTINRLTFFHAHASIPFHFCNCSIFVIVAMNLNSFTTSFHFFFRPQ